MRTLTNKLRLAISISLIAISLVLLGFDHRLWFHAVGLAGYRLGIWGTFEVGDVTLDMQENWFALSEPSVSRTDGSTLSGVLAFKSEWPTFGASNQIGISKVDSQTALKLGVPGPHVIRMAKYPWGTAVIIKPGNAAYLPQYNLIVVGGKGYESRIVEALNDINRINVRINGVTH